MRRIPIGNYLPADTIIHNLDPRVKLFTCMVIIVTVFLAVNYSGLLCTTIFCLVLIFTARIKIGYIFKGLRPLFIIILITFVVHLVLTPGHVLTTLGPFKITAEGLDRGIYMAFRLILLIGSSVLLTATTSPTRLTDGLQSLFRPLLKIRVPVNELALMVSIALRFIPTFALEAQKIAKAQASRGANFQTGGLSERLKNLIPIIVPLFIKSFKRAEELSLAMEARCYRGAVGRTSLYPLSLKKNDYLAIIIIILYLITVLFVRQR